MPIMDPHVMDPRVDAYIAKAADFARPILNHLRKLTHATCPDVTETIKWGIPHFDHMGTLFGMAAFKQHCAIVFWKGELILGNRPGRNTAMGQFGRITSLSDLPNDKVLTSYIRKAVKFNEAGIKNRARHQPKKKLVVPGFFRATIKTNKKALTTFDNLSPSCKREYVGWITEAKREETRARRIETALQWLAEGKSRNWKYR